MVAQHRGGTPPLKGPTRMTRPMRKTSSVAQKTCLEPMCRTCTTCTPFCAQGKEIQEREAKGNSKELGEEVGEDKETGEGESQKPREGKPEGGGVCIKGKAARWPRRQQLRQGHDWAVPCDPSSWRGATPCPPPAARMVPGQGLGETAGLVVGQAMGEVAGPTALQAKSRARRMNRQRWRGLTAHCVT